MTGALALTCGEPAGIGGEIALRAWLARRERNIPPFFLIDDQDRLGRLAAQLEWNVPLVSATPETAERLFPHGLPVLKLRFAKPVTLGRPDPANGKAVVEAITQAAALVRAGKAAGMVTNPIQKETLYQAGFKHPGHTEYLAELGGAPVAMMLVCPGLRVVPVTIHMALRDALAALTTERIVAAGRIAATALRRDFGVTAPRLAVAGLNPHAGENGALGREEIEIVAPAVAALRADGIDATGPFPADTMFHEAARRRYDAALCMYHDQALIPLKTIDFTGGVNVTIGLPFVRTSPDHGTALDIAGTGRADPASLIAALALAGEMAQARHRAAA
ncbi:MAG TPA: 4-hydroxythreonine-4-phosphate dehydrogenase PdxA [Stellaceae bacterium]|nr:4-hydroxythreonine-4-phosphate dehydrogenase PdxA [Stellaceae bacterium]